MNHNIYIKEKSFKYFLIYLKSKPQYIFKTKKVVCNQTNFKYLIIYIKCDLQQVFEIKKIINTF